MSLGGAPAEKLLRACRATPWAHPWCAPLSRFSHARSPPAPALDFCHPPSALTERSRPSGPPLASAPLPSRASEAGCRDQGPAIAVPSGWGLPEGLGCTPPDSETLLGWGSHPGGALMPPSPAHMGLLATRVHPRDAPLNSSLTSLSWGLGGIQGRASALAPGLNFGLPLSLPCNNLGLSDSSHALTRFASSSPTRRRSTSTGRASAAAADVAPADVIRDSDDVSRGGASPAEADSGAGSGRGTGSGGGGGDPEWEAVLGRCAGVRKWLVLVESPSKARLIQKYLNSPSKQSAEAYQEGASTGASVGAGGAAGRGGGGGSDAGVEYRVLATSGHVRQLARNPNAVKPDAGFAMDWQPVEGSQEHLGNILRAMPWAEGLVLATDLDREGEAIAWHTLQVLRSTRRLPRHSGIPVVRATFHEVTEAAVRAALRNPGPIREPLVRAYFARVGVDHLMGFHLSPVLWRKLPGCRSAGRVQSAVLRMVCEREAAHQAFQPVHYWSVSALLSPPPEASSPGSGTLLLGQGAPTGAQKGQGTGHAAGDAHGKVQKAKKTEGEADWEGGGPGDAAAGLVRAELTHWRGVRVAKGEDESGGRRRLTQEMADEALRLLKGLRGRTQGSTGEAEAQSLEKGGGGDGTATGEGGVKGAKAKKGKKGKRSEKGLLVVGTRQWVSQRSPPAPFATSSLQQAASLKLNFSPAVTMQIAQRLYDGSAMEHKEEGEGKGLITYMRTDSVNVAPAAAAALREVAVERYGAASVEGSPRVFPSKAKNAQEAHEAIRPSSPELHPLDLKGSLQDKDWKLYNLIWCRAVASQMKPAVHQHVSAEFADSASNPALQLSASASAVKFPGYLKVYQDDEEPEGNARASVEALERLEEGAVVAVASCEKAEHQTRPPPHFTEASLIKHMEEVGVGRPSTYAPTVKTLKARGYVDVKGREVRPTIRGRLANAFLVRYFGQYINTEFTCKMEEMFDDVAGGSGDWRGVMRHFWAPFSEHVAVAKGIPFAEVSEAVGSVLGSSLLEKAAEDFRRRMGRQEGADAEPRAGDVKSIAGGDENEEDKGRGEGEARGRKEGGEGQREKAVGAQVAAQAGEPKGDVGQDLGSEKVTCPSCKEGHLKYVTSSKGVGLFVACTSFPACAFRSRMAAGAGGAMRIEQDPENRVLGVDSDGLQVSLKTGLFGPYVERESRGKAKATRAPVPVGTDLERLEVKDALKLFEYPITLGEDKETGTPVLLCRGFYGPYLRRGEVNCRLPSGINAEAVTLDVALGLLRQREDKARTMEENRRAKAEKKARKRRGAAVEGDGASADEPLDSSSAGLAAEGPGEEREGGGAGSPREGPKGETRGKKRAVKHKGPKKPFVEKQYVASEELQRFLDSRGPHIPRAQNRNTVTASEASRLVWTYVKEKGLQDPKNREEAFCDEALQALLGQQGVHCLKLRSLLLNRHLRGALQEPAAEAAEGSYVEM